MPVMHRTHGSNVRLMQMTNQELAEIDCPLPRPQLLQPDGLSNERFTNKPFSTSPFDLSVAAHLPRPIANWVFQSRQPTRKTLAALAIYPDRGLLSQRLVRTFGVVALEPYVSSVLLALVRAGRWSCRSLFHHSVELLVRAVLLRVPGRNELYSDAQPYPPGAQTREPGRACGTKGTPVVHAYDCRHPILAKKPPEHCFCTSPSLIGQKLGNQAKSAVKISHRERLDPGAVACSIPTFEIGCPYLIGSSWYRQRRTQSSTRPPCPSPLWLHVSQPFKPATQCADPWQALPRGFLPHFGLDFLSSPVPMFAAQSLHWPAPDPPHLGRTATRRTRVIVQSSATFAKESLFPFIGSFATDAKLATQLNNRLVASEPVAHQSPPLPELGSDFPRHDRRKRPKLHKNCYPCPVTQLLPMSCHRAVRVSPIGHALTPQPSTNSPPRHTLHAHLDCSDSVPLARQIQARGKRAPSRSQASPSK